ncbi:MAG: hypothetical protein ABFS09_06720 [Thermodesulfobacteriota bacterium]
MTILNNLEDQQFTERSGLRRAGAGAGKGQRGGFSFASRPHAEIE